MGGRRKWDGKRKGRLGGGQQESLPLRNTDWIRLMAFHSTRTRWQTGVRIGDPDWYFLHQLQFTGAASRNSRHLAQAVGLRAILSQNWEIWPKPTGPRNHESFLGTNPSDGSPSAGARESTLWGMEHSLQQLNTTRDLNANCKWKCITRQRWNRFFMC